MRFFAGSDIVFGSGSIQQLPELLKPWNGQKAMIVSDPGDGNCRTGTENFGRGRTADTAVF